MKTINSTANVPIHSPSFYSPSLPTKVLDIMHSETLTDRKQPLLTVPQKLNTKDSLLDVLPDTIPTSPATPASLVVTNSENSMTFTDQSRASNADTSPNMLLHYQQMSEEEGEYKQQQNSNTVESKEMNEKQTDNLDGSPLFLNQNRSDNTHPINSEVISTTPKMELSDTRNDNDTIPNLLNDKITSSTNNDQIADSNSVHEFHEALNSYIPSNKKLVPENASYIQDEQSEKVLLNNCTRRRPARRTSYPLARNRSTRGISSIMTRTSFDAATFEIERIKSSIISQRKKKKEKEIDEDTVLVGNKVSEGHVNYVIAYNMLTGIRVSVSRCSGIMRPLTDHDFTACKKLVFDSAGNELTPSSKYDFKFKDYSPEVFRELRHLFGLDPADYLMSLTSKYILSELGSPGKSGSFFYYSRDYRFIIKTIRSAEHHLLRKILKDYYTHVKNNPNTLICQFYGLHRVKMPITSGKKRKIYFIVMNNLFPPHRDIHKTFDLKGSLLGRSSTPKENEHVVFKDLNWIESKQCIKLGPENSQLFMEQLRKDVELLIKLKIMDYSFLVGFHDLKSDNNKKNIQQNNLKFFEPPSSRLKDLKQTNPTRMNRMSDLPAIEYHGVNSFHFNEGGIVAKGDNNEPLNEMYYFGVIDCLTHYSIIKRLETYWRCLTHERKTVSSLPPDEYGKRFLEFIERSLNENTLLQEKNKDD